MFFYFRKKFFPSFLFFIRYNFQPTIFDSLLYIIPIHVSLRNAKFQYAIIKYRGRVLD